MPSGYGPWSAEDHGRGGGVLLLVAAAGVVGFGVVEVVTSEAFAIAVYVAAGVVAVLCAAGVGLVVRELRRPSWGPLWRPARPVEEAVPVAALPVAVPLAIEAPRTVIPAVVLARTDEVTGRPVLATMQRTRQPATPTPGLSRD